MSEEKKSTEIDDLFEEPNNAQETNSETLSGRANERAELSEEDLSQSIEATGGNETEDNKTAVEATTVKTTDRPIRPAIGKNSKKRKERVPIGTQNVLNFETEPGFHYRVESDIKDGERIKRFLAAGYEKVLHRDLLGGDTRAGSDSQMGSPVIRSVGGGIKGVLMRIPQDLYDKDQLAKQKRIDETERSLTRTPPPGAERIADSTGTYGAVKIGEQTNPHIV